VFPVLNLICRPRVWGPGANWKCIRLPPPPYSPELNPAAHVWEYIRENDIRNQIFNTLDAVMDTIETSLRHLHEAPEELHSMTAFPWIFEKAA